MNRELGLLSSVIGIVGILGYFDNLSIYIKGMGMGVMMLNILILWSEQQIPLKIMKPKEVKRDPIFDSFFSEQVEPEKTIASGFVPTETYKKEGERVAKEDK